MLLHWRGTHFMKNTLSVEVMMAPFFIGLLGMKLHKLKFQMLMKMLYGTLLGILLDIFCAVGAMITQQNFGAEIGQGTLVETSLLLATTKATVNKILLLLTVQRGIFLWWNPQQRQDLFHQDWHEMKVQFPV